MRQLLDVFTLAYIEAALWSTNDESNEQGGEPLDANYGIEDIDAATLGVIVADCECFQKENADDISTGGDAQYSANKHAGHDFLFTRNHHGCGFWDGEWENEVGDRLTKACQAYGEVDLYVGDDGKIYV